jgi:MFS family permease
LLAGVLLAHFWWGSVFLVNVPIIALALIGIATLVPNFGSPTPRPLDPAGLLLSISGLASSAYGRRRRSRRRRVRPRRVRRRRSRPELNQTP